MRYLVAMPVYNEARYLAGVLDAVARHATHVLVVDDGSTDATPALLAARPDVQTLRHPQNLGYGRSIIDAFRFAQRHGYEWVITIDCDAQHEPRQIPEFLAEVARDGTDVISGSRYLRAHPADDPPPPERHRINRTITSMLRRFVGLELTDSFCGFKAQRVAALRRLVLDEPGYAFPLQFWVQCVRAGLRIREIPVRRVYHDRSRAFGGALDDPGTRLRHYLEVLMRELGRGAVCAQCAEGLDVCRCA